MTEKKFDGKVAVVTGAASGIGLASAERFAEAGAHVFAIDCNADLGERAATSIRQRGGNCDLCVADLESEEEIRNACARILETTPTIDHVVNAAGIVIVKGIEESTVADWDRVMNVNVRSMFLMTKYLLPALKRAEAGTIVNIGSVSSFVAQANTPAYVASKGAVAMLSKSLCLDLAKYGIRVNCVCPGITDTPMFRYHINQTHSPEQALRKRIDRVPLSRALSPEEIADSVLYLSGRESSGVTGATLLVDAGYLAAAEWSNEVL